MSAEHATPAMTTFDPARDLATLHAQYTFVDELLERFDAQLALAQPACSGWSAEQHLAHLALANELVLKNVKNLVRGEGLLVVRGGEPNPGALPVLESGRIPRGRAQSPRMVRPPEAVDRELMRQWLADGKRELAALDARVVVATELRIPHQLLGPLDAPQWARFGAVHTRHHLEIACEVLSASVGASAVPPLPPL